MRQFNMTHFVSMASDIDELPSQAGEVAEREFVRLLISLYRENPILWDTKNPHYMHKNRRIRTLIRMCDTLKEYKPDYTIELLKKKINILRTNFNKERHKIEARKSAENKDGLVIKDAEPSLWYYSELLFLVEQGIVQPSPTGSFSMKSTSQIPTHKPLQKKKRIPTPTPAPSFRNHQNEADLVTKCWAMKLQRLAPDQRMFAEKIINDTLFEAAMGTLTRHGVTFVTSQPSFVECPNDESNDIVDEENATMFKISPFSD